MQVEYGPYDTNKANVINSPDNEIIFAFPKNMNPFKTMRMACFRNEDNQVVISLMDGNSIMYTPNEWQTLLKTPSLQQEYEKKLDEVIGQAQDAHQHFLENE